MPSSAAPATERGARARRNGQRDALAAGALDIAIVAASFGRLFYVRTPGRNAPDRVAVTRGKRTDLCVGDEVEIALIGEDQAVIETLRPRRTLLQRSDRWRSKLLAANVDQIGVVIAGEPPFSEPLLLRVLIAAEAAGIAVALIVNKCDRSEATAAIRPRIDAYRALGYPVLEISAGPAPQETRAALHDWLSSRTTLLLGQSGMGKSTLVNTLVPDAELRTQAISQVLSSGKHTTTFSRLFDVPAEVADDARIIDTPGFQTFGLAHLSDSQRVHAMREFVPLLGQCRFYNCSHRDEPGCAIREAAQAGRIDELRYRLFTRLEADGD